MERIRRALGGASAAQAVYDLAKDNGAPVALQAIGMKAGDLHPVIKAMNVLGYDCGTLGNHEFNYGLDFMFNVLGGANFPIVCANLTKGALASDPRSDDLFFKPYVIVDKKIKDGAGKTIGVSYIGHKK